MQAAGYTINNNGKTLILKSGYCIPKANFEKHTSVKTSIGETTITTNIPDDPYLVELAKTVVKGPLTIIKDGMSISQQSGILEIVGKASISMSF